MDIPDKFMDLIIAFIVMFFGVILWTSQKMETLADLQIAEYTEDFISEVCRFGFIDRSMYEAYVRKLNSCGTGCKVEMKHIQNIQEPEYIEETFTGGIYEYEEVIYTDKILERIYENGAYLLSKTDRIEIQVKRTYRNMLPISYDGRMKLSYSVAGSVSGINTNLYRSYYVN